MRPLTEIILHCTATREGQPVTIEEIRRWHTGPVRAGGRGWADIGYHFIIDLEGRVHAGRPLEKAGAHVAGRNAHSIGICYIGGVDAAMNPKDTRTPAQKFALEKLIGELLTEYPSITLISGHRDHAAKACPCFDARSEYAHLLPHGQLPSTGMRPAIGTGEVTASILNLRHTPGGEVIGSMPRYTPLKIYGSDGEWMHVATPAGHRGWASRRYIRTAV